MTLRMALLTAAIVFLYASSEAFADQVNAYRWQDKRGDVHITNSLDKVPDEYRSRVKKMKYETASLESVEQRKAYKSAQGRARIRYDSGSGAIKTGATFNQAVRRDVLIDTGSEWVIISSKLAKALSFELSESKTASIRTHEGHTKAPVVTIGNINIGGAQATKVKAVVLDFGGPSSVSAVIGMNFLSAFVFEIDTANDMITLEPVTTD